MLQKRPYDSEVIEAVQENAAEHVPPTLAH